jgi:hypothetical protein
MPQSMFRAAGQSRGMGLMAVSSKQGPTLRFPPSESPTDRRAAHPLSPETAPGPTKTLPGLETNPLTLLRAVRRWAPLPEDAMWKNASVRAYDQKHNRLTPWLFEAIARGWLN